MASSASTLSVIAIERYHAILKPFSSNLRLNEQNIKKAIALIWSDIYFDHILRTHRIHSSSDRSFLLWVLD